jgi:hypothetical protein
MENFEKLAALGAKGVAGGAMAAWLGFVWFIRPVSSGGIDPTSHLVAASASFAVFALISAAHFWFGVQLSKGAAPIEG